MRKLILGLLAPTLAAIAVAVPALAKSDHGAGGVTGPAIYVNGQLYRTVGTPTDFSNTGAPDHSYDTIYAFPNGGSSFQASVATAAPGDPGFNGGRWKVTALVFADADAYQTAVDNYAGVNGVFDTASEVEEAIAGGVMIAAGPSFECPVIPLPKGHGHS